MGFYHIRDIDTSGNIPYKCLIISTGSTPFLAKLLVQMMRLWFVTPFPTSLTYDGLAMATSKVSIFHLGFRQFVVVVRGHLPVSQVIVWVLGSIYLLPTLSPLLFIVPVFYVVNMCWIRFWVFGVGWGVLQPGVFDGALWHACASIFNCER